MLLKGFRRVFPAGGIADLRVGPLLPRDWVDSLFFLIDPGQGSTIDISIGILPNRASLVDESNMLSDGAFVFFHDGLGLDSVGLLIPVSYRAVGGEYLGVRVSSNSFYAFNLIVDVPG